MEKNIQRDVEGKRKRDNREIQMQIQKGIKDGQINTEYKETDIEIDEQIDNGRKCILFYVVNKLNRCNKFSTI